MRDKRIGKWCVFIILLLLLIGRLFILEEQSRWIQGIGFCGVIIALMDLYSTAYRQVGKEDKFKVIRGWAIVIATLLMIISGCMIMNMIELKSRGNDILSILALLISLPNEIYCDWIKKYVEE